MHEELRWGRLQLVSDVSAAAWLLAGLAPRRHPMTLRNLIPAVFPEYARVLPPAESEGKRWRWGEIAAATGAAVHAGTRYREISGWDREPDALAPLPWGVPLDGALPPQETLALANLLAAFTTTPDHAYFCLWDGYGDDQTRSLETRPRPWRVRADDRFYHLLAGPVVAAADLAGDVSYRAASFWWPQDRAWVVAIEIDGFNTFVGGGPDAVAAILIDATLEAVPASPDTLLDPSPWPPRLSQD